MIFLAILFITMADLADVHEKNIVAKFIEVK